MDVHRLPGMSIPATDWDALTLLAEEVGTTRTNLIRLFIQHGINGTATAEQVVELCRTQRELESARGQLEMIRQQLNTITEAAHAASGAVQLDGAAA